MKPTLLELFGGEGGATAGYLAAGFEVIAVDTNAKALERNPARWKMCADWRTALEAFDGAIDAIHASPPCQGYSTTRTLNPVAAAKYPKLIGPVREALQASGVPYVIENVPGSELDGDSVMLCGSMFGLTADWHGDKVYLQRHRLFEASFPIPRLTCDHSAGVRAITVAGHGRMDGAATSERARYWAGPGYQAKRREVMGIDWMTRDGLNEAIPPVYSHYVGRSLLVPLGAGHYLYQPDFELAA